jgi:hypothetical protein
MNSLNPGNDGMNKPDDRIGIVDSVNIIFLILLSSLNVFSPTRLFNLDGLVTSWRISTSGWLDNFYPHHLVYVPLSKFLYSLIPGHSNITPIYILQKWNGAFSVAAILVFYLFSRRLGLKKITALWLCYLIFISFTYAHWSRDVNPYILVNLLVTIAIWLIYEYYFSGKKRSSFFYISALIFGFAALIHQMSIVLILPAVFIIFFQTERKLRIKQTGIYVLIALLPVIAGYLLVSRLVYSGSDLGNPFRLFLFHGSNPNNWIFFRGGFPEHLPAYIYHGILGHYSLFIYSAGPGIYETFSDFPLNNKSFEPGILNRYILPLTLMIISLVMLIRLLIKAIKRPEDKHSFLAAWIIPLFVFLMMWNPGYAFHRIFYLFPFLFVLFTSVQKFPVLPGGQKSYNGPGGKRIAFFAFANVAFLILFLFLLVYNGQVLSAQRENPVYETAISMKEIINQDDLVIVTPDEEYLSRMMRCFTLCERMIAGDFPKSVPALGSIRDADTSLLTESGLPQIFDRIFISQGIYRELESDKKITLTFRLPDDLERRQIIMDMDKWTVAKLKNTDTFYEITLNN